MKQCIDKIRDQFNIIEEGFRPMDLSINVQFGTTNKILEAINQHVVSFEDWINTNGELVESGFTFLGNCFDSIGNSFHLQNLHFGQIQQ